MNKYYVYAYIRLDNNSYFYVGKGCGNRCFQLQGRNEHFNRILNKVDCVIEIVQDNLSEEDAFDLECSMIEDLVFNECYGIDVKGFNIDNEYYLTNATWGGEGSSGRIYIPTKETLKKLSESHLGQQSPMLGKHHSDESKQKMRDGHLGKSPNMSDKAKKDRGQKIKKIRESNNSYGCKQETKDKISNTLKGKLIGDKNGMSKGVICLTDGNIFGSCRQACLFYNLRPSALSKALKYFNGIIDDLQFMFLNDYNANND